LHAEEQLARGLVVLGGEEFRRVPGEGDRRRELSEQAAQQDGREVELVLDDGGIDFVVWDLGGHGGSPRRGMRPGGSIGTEGKRRVNRPSYTWQTHAQDVVDGCAQ
jgi:pimeloyl-ACP methyl ester carboxylesterase